MGALLWPLIYNISGCLPLMYCLPNYWAVKESGRTRDRDGISVCVYVCVCVCLCKSMHVWCFTGAKRVKEVNECPRENTLGEVEVVGGQAGEK